MKTYRALCHIDRGTAQYLSGELLELPDETAERLLAMDPPAIERVAAQDAPAVAPADPKAEKDPPPARLNVEKTVERIKAAPDVTTLLLLQEEEHEHPDGPRKGVVAAIEARFDALGAAEGGD